MAGRARHRYRFHDLREDGINIQTLELTIARGGHPNPIIVKRDGALRPIEADGPFHKGLRRPLNVALSPKAVQALSVRVLEQPPSVAAAHRKPPEEMTAIVEDLIRLLDATSNTLRRGRYPDRTHSS